MRRLCWPLYKHRLLLSDAPILVGPWYSELGFEALYWIPFLSQLRKEQSGLAPLSERLIPITRGGMGSLYATTRSVELYDLRTPQEVRVQTRVNWEKHKSEKQLSMTAFDKAIYVDAAKALGLKSYMTLHPSWMYRRLAPYWDGRRGLEWVSPQLEWSLIPGPDVTLPPLPKHFAAVKFYFRATAESTEQVKSFIQATLEMLASQLPVVVLQTGSFLDLHGEAKFPKMPNVIPLRELIPDLTPANNLAYQGAILKASSLFVGPYGGFAQLAHRMGKPVVSYFESWNYTCLAHKHLTDALSIQFGLPFHVLRLKEIPWLQSVLPQAIVQAAQVPLDMRPAEPELVGI